jgi:two-component system chemotaxis response regulator CheB
MIMQPALRLDVIEAVAIGASAGGIEALGSVLPALPAATRAPVFIVLHLPKDRPSLLPGIFTPRCPLPVREADHDEKVKPGAVYFAPPDYHLLIDSGPRLVLSADDPVCHARPSVDVLFESAADVYGSHLLAIILSGSNQDGARGLAWVRRCGGIAIVQRPETATMPQMPLAALQQLVPDAVLAPQEIASVLQLLPPAGSRTG